eukprot:Awhi_evm1s1497
MPIALSDYSLAMPIEELETLGIDPLAQSEERDSVFSCPVNGTSQVLTNVKTVYNCLNKARYTKANYFNYQIENGICELISCPVTPDKVLKTDVLLYVSSVKHEATNRTFRYIPSNGHRVLSDSCTLLETIGYGFYTQENQKKRTFETSHSCANHTTLTPGGNAYEFLPRGKICM